MIAFFDQFQVTAEQYNNLGVFSLLNDTDKEKLTNEIENFNFIVINKLKTTTYFSLRAGFSPSKTGPILLGVIKDITEITNNAFLLKSKNSELIKSNEELASFNQVVSHDLQEPLRKIQMFISRINSENSEEKNKNYLSKIADTSNKMQQLIKSILHYASLDANEHKFVELDLTTIINDTIDDLDQQIEDAHAKVEVKNLPFVNGEYHLLKQLFNNLLSNAIKYRKPNKDLIISIENESFLEDTLHINNKICLSSKDYHKISINDNGIGFDQQFAPKIFKVFQRLHNFSESKGTGIGLAIAEKVIKIHQGLIDVSSHPNQGTSFYLYLPKNA
ncbi:sensor histidine kinase [Aquimarina agarilytica]|uniref:sensor histidine kinase n=1 Tax=Aquimarina agarilytica TaxID=1087449 RepID=UPI0002D9BE92|nr:ATP-binding protein [Aquimarina agarilytica]